MDADPKQYENIAVNESDIHKIVVSYLVHNCFKDTLESFVACTGVKQPIDHLEGMDKRKRIFNFALDGNASKAIELTEEFVPGLLEENKDLHFDLLSLNFVELVCSRKIDEALGFAQSKFTPFGKEQKYVEKLEDFMALLAYEEPEKSPMFHLLSEEHRQHVADSLNRAILARTKLPSFSVMERLIQQTTVVKQYLSQESSKDGFFRKTIHVLRRWLYLSKHEGFFRNLSLPMGLDEICPIYDYEMLFISSTIQDGHQPFSLADFLKS